MEKVKNLDDLQILADKIRTKNGYKDPIAFGIARVDLGKNEKKLGANYAVVNFNENFTTAAILSYALEKNGVKIDFDDSEFVVELTKEIVSTTLEIFNFLKDEAKNDKHKNLQNLIILDEIFNQKQLKNAKFCLCFIFKDEAVKSLEAVYLKLYLLSLNKALIRSLNLNGAFGILPNLAWDSHNKPYELDYLRENEIWLKMSGTYPAIVSVDKFPRFLSHIIPADNTRILDSSKVRMGASIAPGTTIMPGASYVNFNSGTTGAVMVEGRVSSSVIVGEGSDIGGGASILGVLSGTNGNPISIGKRCLLGANSVTGIPLGDDCIIDAGIAILEGTKIFISKKDRDELAKINPNFNLNKDIFKGIELANLNAIHYRSDSQTGQILGKISKRAIELNSQLH